MSFTKLFNIVDEKTQSLIKNLSSGYIEVPYLIEEILKLLEDSHPLSDLILEINKKHLCKLIEQYFTDCWEIYAEDIPFDKLLNYGRIEVYKVNAYNGLRYATEKEVKQGIKGLIPEHIYPAGEEAYKNLCLMYWTFTGRNYYLRQSGVSIDFKYEGGKLMTSFYEIIQKSFADLQNMIRYVSINENIELALKKIKKMQKTNGYKYATYEKDEIEEDVSVKQLLLNIYDFFPRQSNVPEYRKALALVLKHRSGKMLSPLEISELRTIYDKFAMDSTMTLTKKANLSYAEKIKSMCDEIMKGKEIGKISEKHFAFVIIPTLVKFNYKCSPKQLAILEDALDIIKGIKVDEKNKPKETDGAKTEIISEDDVDSSLSSISDMIGQGLFGEDDD